MGQLLEPIKFTNNVYTDQRGTFIPFEIADKFNRFYIHQINTVTTKTPYTFRGMHWQEPPYDQGKILRCSFGKIIDFALDIRNGSPNFGKAYSFSLSSPDEWVYIPRGFAHGYLTLPHNLGSTYPTMVDYIIDNNYDPKSERGVFLTDELHKMIRQEMPMSMEIIMNDRDLSWPTIDEIKTEFKYENREEPDEQ